MVFVLDTKKKPLMPCTPKRARQLLARGRAVVHRVAPFVIRLKDRQVEDSVLQPLALKIDPGSQTTGMTLARVEDRSEGAIHHAVLLAEVQHRGHEVRARKVTQRHARRRRRSANLRHRAARAANRRIARGWLPPSLLSRIGNVVSWTKRLRRFAPVTRVDVECVRFDTQLLQNPEITGVQYQHGELLGGKYEPISCSNMRTSASTAENATHLLSSIISGPVAEAGPVASRTWHWPVTTAIGRKGRKRRRNGGTRKWRCRHKHRSGMRRR